MSGYLLDTNVISELTRPKPAAQVVEWLESLDESLLFLSVLTLGEIRKGITVLTTGRRRSILEAWLDTELAFRFAGRVLPIDTEIADCWGHLTGEAESHGRKVPVIDGLLAATSAVRHLTLATRNVTDFAPLGVAIFNPWNES